MKKGTTNNPHGRPPKHPDDKYTTPVRNLGRVDNATWMMLKDAAEAAGFDTFISWALPILTRAAKKVKKVSRDV